MTAVAITGIGVVSSLGNNTGDFWRGCLDGAAPAAAIPDHWHAYYDFRSTSWVPLTPPDYAAVGLTRSERMQNDGVSLIALCAATEALANAGISLSVSNPRANSYTLDGVDPNRAMVCMGTGTGGARSFLENYCHHAMLRPLARLREELVQQALTPPVTETLEAFRYPRRFNPFVVSMLMPNAVSAALGIKFGITGASRMYATACASGTVALGHAFRAIRAGEADVCLAGGTEYLDDDYGGIFRGFDAAGTLARGDNPDTVNRPFDKDRSGFLYSQGGAAVLVLENADHARARGQPILGLIGGYAETFDAYSMMSLAPDGGQIERTLRDAVADADLGVSDIDYLNAHGTSTQINDEIEAGVIQRVFERGVAVNSTKSLLGHTIGASGALEAAVCALSLRDGRTHPSRNLDQAIADLDFVRDSAPRRMRSAISQSFAFGGHNAALVLLHPDS